jgi:hypothetical protein
MQFIQSYASFNQPYVAPTMLWNADLKCIKMGEHYVFLESGMVREAIALSDELSNDTSSWVHTGVDVISSIASSIPGGGTAASLFIDLIHTVSYFIEADNSRDTTLKASLALQGCITGVMTVSNIPVVKNVIGIIMKSAGKNLVGNFIKTILSMGAKVSKDAVKSIVESILNIRSLSNQLKNLLATLRKNSLFNSFNEIPTFKSVVDFIERKISNVVDDAAEIVKKEVASYKFNLKKDLKNILIAGYNSLEAGQKKRTTQDEFVRLGVQLSEKLFRDDLRGSLLTSDGIIDSVKKSIFNQNEEENKK